MSGFFSDRRSFKTVAVFPFIIFFFIVCRNNKVQSLQRNFTFTKSSHFLTVSKLTIIKVIGMRLRIFTIDPIARFIARINKNK